MARWIHGLGLAVLAASLAGCGARSGVAPAAATATTGAATKVITDYSTAALAVKTGSLDITSVDPVTARQYENVPGVKVVAQSGLNIELYVAQNIWLINDRVQGFQPTPLYTGPFLSKVSLAARGT